jgi:uncharacterized protein YbjT (DUF2867 family)
LAKGDVFDLRTLHAALEGVDIAYYLIHSLAGKGAYEEKDRKAAKMFSEAAGHAGVKRIIYLGGLGRGPGLSHHLASRQEVGRILRESSVPTLEFRSSIVIGCGSLSFEMVRSLVQKLPVMTTPKWVRTLTQPISIEDVIAYLVAALDIHADSSMVFEIGGADRLSYQGIMREYARIIGLRRLIIPVPVLTPWLSSLWLALVTPLFFQVGRRLIEGVKNETVVQENRAFTLFPLKPRGIREAILRALEAENREFSEARWSEILPSKNLKSHWRSTRIGSRIVDSHKIHIPTSSEKSFLSLCKIGNKSGGYQFKGLWHARIFLDLILGGVGKKRERRDPENLLPGDTIGFWRVEAVENNQLLRLIAEMKIPGQAWLQFEVVEKGSGSVIRQTTIFEPRGLAGLFYWYALYPLHQMVFRRMLKKIFESEVE